MNATYLREALQTLVKYASILEETSSLIVATSIDQDYFDDMLETWMSEYWKQPELDHTKRFAHYANPIVRTHPAKRYKPTKCYWQFDLDDEAFQ